MSVGLTRAQSDCLGLIEVRMADRGIAPTFEEMREHLGLRSKSGVDRILRGLEDRGYIRRFPRQARAIELIRQDPIVICPHCGHPARSEKCRAAAALSRALSQPSSQNTSQAIPPSITGGVRT